MDTPYAKPNPSQATRKRKARRPRPNAPAEGFYAPQFDPRERGDLQDLLVGGLHDEIAMLRVVIRRVLELAEGVEDLEQAIQWLNAMGAASTRLATLLRTQKELLGDGDRVAEALSQALTEVTREFGLQR